MKVQFQDIGDLQNVDPASIKQAIIIPAKTALQQLRQLVTGNLTLKDNAYAAVVTFGAIAGTSNASLTSGTEYTFANPLPTKPIGFTPIVSTNTSGTAVPISSWQLNTSRTDGLIGVTVNQDMQHTLPCLIKTASVSQSIANASDTALTGWNTTRKTRGSVITDDGSTFTVSEAGTYAIAIFAYAETGTYTAFQLYVKLGTGENIVQPFISAALTDAPELAGDMIIDLAASGTFVVRAFQSNVAVAARNIIGGTSGRRVSIHRLYNDTVPSMLITGILWGG